ncbi:Transport and Golgi organization 2 homolog [Linum grandiflorum]
MCIAAFLWRAHPLYPLLLLHNRDEYHKRPTAAVEWWTDIDIVGGRDEVAGGTWLACSRGGRVVFLTNVMELHERPDAKSRGELPLLFLQSCKAPREFAEGLAKEADQYNGFNLILADILSNTMVYVSNRAKGKEAFIIQNVSPGIHVLSNAHLDSPWPKVFPPSSSSLVPFTFSFSLQRFDLSHAIAGAETTAGLQTTAGEVRRWKNPFEGDSKEADERQIQS